MGNIQTAEFLEKLLRKAGNTIDEETKAALASKDMSQISDELAAKIEGGLMNLTEATNHPEVRRKAIGERLGGMDGQYWQIARDVFGLSREEFGKVRGAYNPETKKHEGSIVDTWPKIMSFFNELSEKRGESRGNVDTTAIRAELSDKFKADYEGKLSANKVTISKYETDFQELLEKLEKKDRENVIFQEGVERRVWLEGESNKYLPKLKKEYLNVADLLVKKYKEDVLSKYSVLLDDGKYQLFQKADPSARALDGKNNMIDLQEHIAEFWSEYINPNPDPGAGGNGGTKTVTTGGKPTRKLSAW